MLPHRLLNNIAVSTRPFGKPPTIHNTNRQAKCRSSFPAQDMIPKPSTLNRGYIGDDGKENGSYYYRGFIGDILGMMEKKMERA